MRKQYQIFYVIKHNRKEEINHIFVMANNKKEAYQRCKVVVFEKTGRNAFRPTTNVEDLIK